MVHSPQQDGVQGGLSHEHMQGKDKPTFAPNKDEGDVVIVKNAKHVSFTGKKWDRKLYRWHTG